nr:MAG TPA: hypothetical protein [Bacteriophage sp.]DAY70498.1 MAG TPA: hypothetical protein [Caudoviricetes sp.]
MIIANFVLILYNISVYLSSIKKEKVSNSDKVALLLLFYLYTIIINCYNTYIYMILKFSFPSWGSRVRASFTAHLKIRQFIDNCLIFYMNKLMYEE